MIFGPTSDLLNMDGKFQFGVCYQSFHLCPLPVFDSLFSVILVGKGAHWNRPIL